MVYYHKMNSENVNMHGRVYFVSGIDTDVGKTVVTGLMARWLLARGTDATTVKMVQTGCDGISEDIEVHRAMCGVGRLPEDDGKCAGRQHLAWAVRP